MKLIDVDRFIEDYGHHHTESMSPYLDREKLHAFNDGIDFMVDMLKDESESVVRCKDCKWWGNIYNCPMVMCDQYEDEAINNAEPEWFCSQGVREE